MNDKPRYVPAIHHRRSIRLKGYDYSQAGAYFITICTHNRECLFGEIIRPDSQPAPTTSIKQHALPEIVRQFKTFSARRINEQRGTRGAPIWQRNYWEHIIRDEKSYHDIATYIVNNPANWEMDKLYLIGNL
jgi:REP element-mobilizing transposase RayT